MPLPLEITAPVAEAATVALRKPIICRNVGNRVSEVRTLTQYLVERLLRGVLVPLGEVNHILLLGMPFFAPY